MLSLQNICVQNIAEEIYTLPVQTQETLLNETRDIIREKVKSEMTREIIQSLKEEIYKEVCEDISIIAPGIFRDILETMRTSNRMRRNYYAIYGSFSTKSVQASTVIAETIVNSMDDEDIFRNSRDFLDYNISYETSNMYDSMDDSDVDSESS
jgi:hypothetical protein